MEMSLFRQKELRISSVELHNRSLLRDPIDYIHKPEANPKHRWATKRRRTMNASNNGLVPERREKTARQTPEKMGRLSESIRADCGAGIPLVNRGQGPAKMENPGIRALRLNTERKKKSRS